MSDVWRDPVKHSDFWCHPDSPIRVTVKWDEGWRFWPEQRRWRWVAKVWTREHASIYTDAEFFRLEEWEAGFNTTSPVVALHLFTSCRFATKDEAVEWGKAASDRLCGMRRDAEAQRDLRHAETVMVMACDEGVVKSWEKQPEPSRF